MSSAIFAPRATGPLALALLALPAAALEVCDDCGPRKLCKPHAELEQAELERLRPELEADEAGERMAALRALAALTDAHRNAPSKTVARLLAAALEDRSLQVRSRALRLLTEGQEPEVTVVALVELLEGFEQNMWSLVPWLTGDAQERGTVVDAMDHLETAMQVSARVPDDRVAEALASVLLAFPSEMRGQPVAMAATRSLLELGTRDAVRAVLRQLDSRPEGPELESLQAALVDFALDLGLDDAPQPGEDLARRWDRWLKKHSGKLPSKLGKWRGTPAGEQDDEQDDE